MKKIVKRFMRKENLFNMLSLSIMAVSVYGANTRCVAFFHDIEKPKSLESLKKY
ncbi:MAG: hypothetical protein R3Y24_07895 [Eubacteriales bacterium]